MQRDPFRLTILKRLTALLDTRIGPAGCDFDMIGKVFRGRIVFGQQIALPYLSVLERPVAAVSGREIPVAGDGVLSINQWLLFIQGFIADEQQAPTDQAYRLLAAVQHRLALISKKGSMGLPVDPDAYMLGDNVADFQQLGPVVRPPEAETSDVAYFYLPVVLTLAHDVSQPFEAG